MTPEVGYWEVGERKGRDGNRDISFSVLNPGCPSEQKLLKNEVERTLTSLRLIYNSQDLKPKSDEAFDKLLALSQLGLVGTDPSTTIALDALRSLKADIVDMEAGRVKNAYVSKLGLWALVFGALSLLLYHWFGASSTDDFKMISEHRNIFLVWFGGLAGTWASFSARKVVLTFFDLAILEEDRVSPPLRLVFVLVLISFLALTFITGLADVVLGSFKASNLIHSGSVALLVGGLAGLTETALPTTLLQRAQSLFAQREKGG